MTPGCGLISKTLIFGGADSGENLANAMAAVRPEPIAVHQYVVKRGKRTGIRD
jgi:hypothetical protein